MNMGDLLLGLAIGLNIGMMVERYLTNRRSKNALNEMEKAHDKFKEAMEGLRGSLSDLKKIPPPIPQDDDPFSNDLSDLPPEIMVKLEQLGALSQESAHLAASINQPQRNGLDGRDKQRGAGRFKMIQEEITQIMESILAAGYDLNIMVMDMNTGARKADKLSNVLADLKGRNGMKAGKPGPNLSLIRTDKDKKDDGEGGPTTH